MHDILKALPDEFLDQSLMMSTLMTPSYTNFASRVHGGFLLKLLDEAAYICVARYCGGYAITAAMHETQFLNPVFVKELLHIYGSVDYTGRSSMAVSLNAVAEDVEKGTLRYVLCSKMTMVAVNDDKTPIAVKPFVPQTEQEKKRYEMAKIRRELLQEYEARVKQVK